MPDCTREADTRMVVYIIHALLEGSKKILVRTVDTDHLVILIDQFFDLQQLCAEIDLCVAFGGGKDYCLDSII